MLNPKLRKDAAGVWWLNWTSVPGVRGYDVAVSWRQAHIQAGPRSKTMKLGRPKQPFTCSISVKGHAAYETIRQPKLSPMPPPVIPGLTLQRTIFWAQIDDDAVGYATQLRGWRHALTADSGASVPTAAQVNALKAHSAGVDAWGNQYQIPAQQIADFHRDWGLDRIIHQAENQPEAACLNAAYAIGNFTREGLGPEWEVCKAKVEAGKLAASFEAYDGDPSNDSTQGLPVSSFTLGVWMDAGVHYPLADLLAKIPEGARPGVCIWHGTPTLNDRADRQALMAL